MLSSAAESTSRRLLAVDYLIHVAMKKSILDVQLIDGPHMRGGNAEDCPYH